MLQLGKETAEQALGKTWRFGRVTVGLLEEFREWVAERVGDPFADADKYLGKVPEAEGLRLLEEARKTRDDLAAFSLSNALSQRFLGTELGAAKLAHLLLQVNHPDVTPDEALAVWMEVGRKEQERILRRGQGEAPKNSDAPPAA